MNLVGCEWDKKKTKKKQLDAVIRKAFLPYRRRHQHHVWEGSLWDRSSQFDRMAFSLQFSPDHSIVYCGLCVCASLAWLQVRSFCCVFHYFFFYYLKSSWLASVEISGCWSWMRTCVTADPALFQLYCIESPVCLTYMFLKSINADIGRTYRQKFYVSLDLCSDELNTLLAL